ncbi:MAG TPA: SRPBCC family protein [Flavitalea sp.]|nr:SRPBCC family protein [Flavitalea sp.]
MTTKNQTRVKVEPGKQELFITREFDAPRELVFKAFTDPELLVKWMGPRQLSTKIDRFESGSGGSWRFVQADNNGNEVGFHGVCHEETAPERTIRTFEFEGLPEKGHVALETARFEVLPAGRTRVTIQSVFQSVSDRDGMVQSGMEEGVNESHERLDELLEDM